MDFVTRMVEEFKVCPIIYYSRKKKVNEVRGEASNSIQSGNSDWKNKCDGSMSKKWFDDDETMHEKKFCRFFSRPWSPQKSVYENLYVDNAFKWPIQRLENVEKPLPCQQSAKRGKKKRRTCKPKKKSYSQPCVYDLVENGQCVLCFENLYVKGHICDLFKKVPLIKKQSEVNRDNVAMAIEERNRIVVHKKCYDVYTDPLSSRWKLYSNKIAEIINNVNISDLISASQPTDEKGGDSNCGQEEEKIDKTKICKC